jgi:sugar (pentulose or hexulose) kinase
MGVLLGIDLGTTTITAVALDTNTGNIIALATTPNQAATTAAADRQRGFSEWDAPAIAAGACSCMATLAEQLPQRGAEIAGIGITGQQHGVVIVDQGLTPLSPFINWQDRRTEEAFPGSDRSYTQEAVARLGAQAPARAGCQLAAGYLAATLFWMKETRVLPTSGSACFLGDYFGALLTGARPVTEPTNAASSGVLDVSRILWDGELLQRLGLPTMLFPEIRPAGTKIGVLERGPAERAGLPAGIPVFIAIGDNQASFLGTVADRERSVLVNVGTGGQVAAWTDRFLYDSLLETRPFPQGGYLLVSAGLCGGRSYALLEAFYRQVGTQLLNVPAAALYTRMSELARSAPPGADGLRCEPYFTGTRADPSLRASWTGMSAVNFTPGHMTRALLEGMARAFRTGQETIVKHCPGHDLLVGAGNGLRENPLLAQIVAWEFRLPMRFAVHREEAAFGAALLAAVSVGCFPDVRSAGRMIRYEQVGQ